MPAAYTSGSVPPMPAAAMLCDPACRKRMLHLDFTGCTSKSLQSEFWAASLTYAHVLHSQVSRSISSSASAFTTSPAHQLDALAETARLLGAPDIKPPSLVIITGLAEAGKSHLGNQ
eukprot:1044393-Pelagomonas_calceolata.AAC.1